MSTLPKRPPEADEHFDRAVSIKGDDKSALNERAAELALAIKKANGFFPISIKKKLLMAKWLQKNIF